ncbi:tRNA(Ser) Um(44) 2'-O-methyltransferase [Coemansia sp. Cherry 401B]|nr:tRNA(Ser) Um(44) 2'-O-methyltransferase [Coemansia sp. RSA 2704]KAJ2738459.1 tRNA(Ser) Um(44) 2'-O-methyltransferase [Coemansia sp. Cherry 401B]
MAHQMLGAEETDTAIEALRIAEFAKFRPTYHLNEVKSVDVGSNQWRVLASVDIQDSEDVHFLSVMDKWTHAAETIIPPVKRTEIMELAKDAVPTHGDAELGIMASHTRRVLIPKRQGKDRPLEEDVVISRLDSDIYACFAPRANDPSEIPFYYQQAVAYAFGYLSPGDDHGLCQLVILVREPVAGSATATNKQRMVWQDLLKRLYKWTVTERFGYQKRVEHDVVVGYEQYVAKYQELKAKYALRWVEGWTEQTDPKKFVYEDIAIASWLICLWEQDVDSNGSDRPTFVDLGCGNGFLVYLLTSEGYAGYGIDQCSRKIWTQYDCQVDLRTQTLEPFNFVADVDWVIGNHADELAPWVPVIAARSSKPNASFVVIPCCPHELSGKKMPLKATAGQSKYHIYVKYICELSEQCGFEVEREYLRIPSTKNVAVLGRKRTDRDCRDAVETLAASGQHRFVARVPDAVKNELRLEKAKHRAFRPAESQ